MLSINNHRTELDRCATYSFADESPKGETVLVTGATGFTGSHLAHRLWREGAEVRVLVRTSSSRRSSVPRARYTVIDGDLGNRDDVMRATEGVDRMFHIAALYRDARHSNRHYHDVNIKGTENAVAAAREHGVRRLIHCSTAGVHGEVSEIPATESSPFNPGDIYQQTKLDAEQYVAETMDAGLPSVIFRPVGIYGPGDLRFLKLFKTIQQGRFRMFGTGEVVYHLTYIDDLIDGIILCGYHPNASGNTYLLAGPRYTTLNQLVVLVAECVGVAPPRSRLPMWPLTAAACICEATCRMLGVEPPLHRRRIDFFRKNRAFSSEKARRELGYQPRIDLRDGLTRTAAWYIDQGYLRNTPRAAAIGSGA